MAIRGLRLGVDHDEAHSLAETDDTWIDEITSRVDEILAGGVDLVDPDETLRLLTAELAEKRR
ncbi:hypothetical protein [Brachybacterium subflavum]|uniref:hypothetical protein n=1 Tax=Brachybacterium subflavum TaxID=2585206 RepID=UPI0012665CA2|nr:hypothetical protein [Brachybacterium subflavum]